MKMSIQTLTKSDLSSNFGIITELTVTSYGIPIFRILSSSFSPKCFSGFSLGVLSTVFESYFVILLNFPEKLESQSQK